jgi:hypothetical protein
MNNKLQVKILEYLDRKTTAIETQLIGFLITEGYCKPYIELSIKTLKDNGEVYKVGNILSLTVNKVQL